MLERSTYNIARSVAPLLSGAWRYHALKSDKARDYYDKRAIVSNGKLSILICEGDYKTGPDRIIIWGILPKGFSPNGIYNKITVNRHRSIKAIARDIDNRLMPGFLEKYLEVIDENRICSERKELLKLKVNLVKKFIPVLRSYHGSDSRFNWTGGDIDLAHYSNTVRLNLDVPFEKALKNIGYALK